MPTPPTEFHEIAPMLGVPDVEATAKYYEAKLGFEIEFVATGTDLPSYAVVYRDGFYLHFIERDVCLEPGILGGVNISVDDVDQYYQELQERGALRADFPTAFPAIREHSPEDKEYGRRDMILVDPNGYILVFGQDLEEMDEE